MSQQQISNVSTEKLMEKLFLKSCVPQMKVLMRNMLQKACTGCEPYFMPNQLAHTCIIPPEEKLPLNIYMEMVVKAAPYMAHETDKVLDEMHRIHHKNEEYAQLTLGHFLDFFGSASHPWPIGQLTWDKEWQQTIVRMVCKEEGVYFGEPDDGIENEEVKEEIDVTMDLFSDDENWGENFFGTDSMNISPIIIVWSL